jgi:hypothetical protein
MLAWSDAIRPCSLCTTARSANLLFDFFGSETLMAQGTFLDATNTPLTR